GDDDGGEEIFAAATDFGEAVEIFLRRRPNDPEPTLAINEVADSFERIAAIEGRNSRRRKLDELRDLFVRASALEGKYLAKILIREMRHGMSDGLMLEAIARMSNRPVAEIRRAHMLETDLGRVVGLMRSPRVDAPGPLSGSVPVALQSGETADKSAGQAGRPAIMEPAPAGSDDQALSLAAPDARPIRPMLAAPAPRIADAFEILGPGLALEHKLDGARVQIHCTRAGIRIFSRRMNDISPSLPEVTEMMAPIVERQAILDGEVIAVGSGGKQLAFQELMRRFGRVREVERLRAEQPIRLFVFDLIGCDGQLLIDAPYAERYRALSEIAEQGGLQLATRIVPASVKEGELFYANAVAAGFEGVMAKGLASLYTPGARGRGWLKIKPARTLDLVIVAADWGYGRRHGWLSNYHLAARDPHRGELVEVGKTFKGMTDADFKEMTERLLALKTGERGGTVFVRPEVVVEVAYSDLQRSPRYAGGIALRFARILNVRADKAPEEADTIETMTAQFDRQIVKPLTSGN
ncbi:MAG TPA: ATP-dependent DNA ligase, partial [Candidatus Binataceae bacterium]|nr:ATP-dependent DNA ligase [Candidatus Binataceae bacterium]